MRTWRVLLGVGVGVSSIGTTGCGSAAYRWGEPKVVSSQTLSVETRPEFASGLTFDKATIDGTTLRVQATRACTTMRDTVTENVIEREELREWEGNSAATRIEKDNGNVPGLLTLFGLLPSGILLGISLPGVTQGSACISKTIGEQGEPGYAERNASMCGREALEFTITGAALATASLVGIRIWYGMRFGTEPPRRVASWSTTSVAASACTSKEASGLLLFAALGDRVVELGKTDAQGKLEVTLDQFIDAKALLAGGARWTLKLAVGGATETPIEVKTDVFFAAMDEAVWKATDEPICAKQKTREACTNVARYASLYPAGKHAREAAALNVAVVPVLEGGKP